MVKAKTDGTNPEKSFMDKLFEGIEAERKHVQSLPLKGERWYVEEFIPARRKPWNYDDLDDWWPSEKKRVTDYFDNEADAEEFIDTHLPDYDDGYLEIVYEHAREHTIVEVKWHRG